MAGPEKAYSQFTQWLKGDELIAWLEARALKNQDAKLDKILAQQSLIIRYLGIIAKKENAIMADLATETDAINANTAALNQIVDIATTLAEGQATIDAEIEALKAKIASSGVDTSALDQAITNQKAVVDKLSGLFPTSPVPTS